MPALRNVSRYQGRSSARLERRVPVAYDREGWEVPVGETLQSLCLSRGDSPHPVPHSHLERTSTPPSTKPDPTADSINLEDPKLSLAPNSRPRRPRAASIASSVSPTSSSSSPLPSPSSPPPMTSSKTRSKPYAPKASSKRDDHVRRPRNAFIVFRSHYNKMIEEQRFTEGPKMNQNNVSKDAGHIWNDLPEKEKDYFRRLAKQESDEHKRNHPGYRYAPHGNKKPAASKSKSASRGKGKRASKVSDDESDAEFDPESGVSAPGSSPRRSTRIRPSTRRYTSPSPSSRSASPTPSVTHSVSTQESCDEALTDGEDEFVETENIPTIELTPRDLEQKDEPKLPVFVPRTPDLDRREIPAFMDNTAYLFGVGPLSKIHGLRSDVQDPFFGDASPVDTFDMDVELPGASSSLSLSTSPFDMGACGYDANDPWASTLSSTADSFMDLYLNTALCD